MTPITQMRVFIAAGLAVGLGVIGLTLADAGSPLAAIDWVVAVAAFFVASLAVQALRRRMGGSSDLRTSSWFLSAHLVGAWSLLLLVFANVVAIANSLLALDPSGRGSVGFVLGLAMGAFIPLLIRWIWNTSAAALAHRRRSIKIAGVPH